MPRRIEAGRRPSGVLSDGREGPRSPGSAVGQRWRRRLRGGALLAAPAALVAVALDLAGELVGDQVDRVLDLARGLLRAQGHALEMQRRLGHLALGIRGVALLRELDLEHRQLGDLLADLLEAPLDTLAELVGDLKVPSLHLDLHGTPLCRRGRGWIVDERAPLDEAGSTVPRSGRRRESELPGPA